MEKERPLRVSITIPDEYKEDFKTVCECQTRKPTNFVLHSTLSELKKAVSRYKNQGKM